MGTVESLMPAVLTAIHAIQARDQYPSCRAIAAELDIDPGKSTTIHHARRLLVRRGLLAFDIRSEWSTERRSAAQTPRVPGLDGRTPAELDEATGRAARVRQEALADLQRRDADLPRIAGRVPLEVVSSPSLDALPPWRVSRIVRRRTRRLFATRRITSA